MAIHTSCTETQPNRTETETETHIEASGRERGGIHSTHSTAQQKQKQKQGSNGDERRTARPSNSTEYVRTGRPKQKYLYLRGEQSGQPTNKQGTSGVGDCMRTVAGLRLCTAHARRLICVVAHWRALQLEEQRMHSTGTEY